MIKQRLECGLQAPVTRTIVLSVAFIALTTLSACGGGGSTANPQGAAVEQNDEPAVVPSGDVDTTPRPSPDEGSQAIFTIDQTVIDLGGLRPENVANTEVSVESEYLTSFSFVDNRGVSVDLLVDELFLPMLEVKYGINVEGFTAGSLVTDGFVSVVYPDDYSAQRIVKMNASEASDVIVYYPDGQMFKRLPAARTVDNAFEVYLPKNSKQVFFALLAKGAQIQ